MKRMGAIAVCALVCSAMQAQIRTVPKERLLEQLSPRLSIDSTALAFERLELETPPMSEDSEPVSLDFPFRNVSNREITIVKTVSSCSCVRVSLSRKSLAPGQEAVLTAIYDPEGHPGKFSRRIFVYTAASEQHPATVLRVNAEVAQKAGPEGEYPYVCGSLRLRRNSFELSSKPETVHIRCYNSGSRPLKISAETAFIPFPLSFSCEPGIIAPGEEAVLIMKIDAGAAADGTYPLILKGCGATPSESRIMIKKTTE